MSEDTPNAVELDERFHPHASCLCLPLDPCRCGGRSTNRECPCYRNDSRVVAWSEATDV